MRISNFTIKNYKGIENIRLWMPKTKAESPSSGNLLSIIGKNNVGKSSILNALHKALELSRATQEDFPQHNSDDKIISVEIAFDDLSSIDKAKPAIRPYQQSDDSYVIRVEWNKPNIAPARKVRDIKVTYLHPDEPKKKASWESHPQWGAIVTEHEKRHGTFSPKKEDIGRLETIAYELGASSLFKIDTNEDWKSDDAYRSNPAGWQSLLLNALPRVVYVPAIRETKDEAEISKRGASIRSLVQHLFEKQLDTNQSVQSLKKAAAQVSELFSEQGKNPFVAQMENAINNILIPLAGVSGRLKFAHDGIGVDLMGYSEFWLKDKFGPETKPEHHGHGPQRALVLSLLQALADTKATESSGRGLVLLFEEPEIYLHPEMCRKMRDTLVALSRRKDTQVICTTHSPVLLDLAERHDGIVLLRKNPDTGIVNSFQRTSDIFDPEKQKEERQRLRMVLDFDPSVTELFFTEHVCLLEGDTEVASVNAIAEKLIETQQISREQYREARHNVILLNCRSKATMPAFQHVLNEFRIMYRVVHDSDSDKNSAGSITLNNNIETLLRRIRPEDWKQALLVHEPDFDQHALGEAFADDKPWRAHKNITERANFDNTTALLNFFEFCLHKSLSELAPKLQVDETDSDVSPQRLSLPWRNRRSQYNSYREVLLSTAKATKPCAIIGIAAGNGVIEGLDDFLSSEHLGSEYIVAKVNGHSMCNTLINGERILLKKINVMLDSAADEESMASIEDFQKNIKHDRIYVLAINDGIDIFQYTIKRVLYNGAGRNWICRIVADNPEADWYSRGEFVVRRTDKIHFAAELVDLVKDAERPYSAAEEASIDNPHETRASSMSKNS